jgi:hypothetical protein
MTLYGAAALPPRSRVVGFPMTPCPPRGRRNAAIASRAVTEKVNRLLAKYLSPVVGRFGQPSFPDDCG